MKKEVVGTVVSNKMNKTVVVQLERKEAHPQYGKVITKKRRVYAHDEKNDKKIGDAVTIVETRPISKLKRWRVVG